MKKGIDYKIKKIQITALQRFKNQNVLLKEFGENGLKVYKEIDNKKTSEEIRERVGVDVEKFVKIIDFMEKNGMIELVSVETQEKKEEKKEIEKPPEKVKKESKKVEFEKPDVKPKEPEEEIEEIEPIGEKESKKVEFEKTDVKPKEPEEEIEEIEPIGEKEVEEIEPIEEKVEITREIIEPKKRIKEKIVQARDVEPEEEVKKESKKIEFEKTDVKPKEPEEEIEEIEPIGEKEVEEIEPVKEVKKEETKSIKSGEIEEIEDIEPYSDSEDSESDEGSVEKIIRDKYGAIGIAVYTLIDGEKSAEEIMKETGLTEAKLVEILDFLEEKGIIKLEYPDKKKKPPRESEKRSVGSSEDIDSKFKPLTDKKIMPVTPKGMKTIDVPVKLPMDIVKSVQLKAKIMLEFGDRGSNILEAINGKNNIIDIVSKRKISLTFLMKVINFLLENNAILLKPLAREQIQKEFGVEAYRVYKKFGREGVLLYELVGKEGMSIKEMMKKVTKNKEEFVEMFIFIHNVLNVPIPVERDILLKRLGE